MTNNVALKSMRNRLVFARRPSALVGPATIGVLIVHAMNIVVHLAHGFTPAPREWWLESRQLRSGLFISAVVYVVGALGFEVLGQQYAANHGWSNPVYVAFAAVEEFLEMCGPVIFLHCVGREIAKTS